MIKNLVSTILVATVLLLPSKMLAWGTTGHRVVAQIAEDNIKPSTRKKINKLLDNLPMAYWANWPDFIKSDKTGEWDHTHIWHYVNAPGDLSYDQFVEYIQNVPQENVYSEIPKLEKIIQDKKSTDEQKRIALIFLIHLLGDAHQPMHVGKAEDLGGNKVQLYWFNSPTNLHSIWDGKLVDFEKYSYSEYADILNRIPKDKKQELQNGTLEDWLFESHALADEIYANVNDGDKLWYEYSYKYKPVTELQLQRAGLRLAATLDKVFK